MRAYVSAYFLFNLVLVKRFRAIITHCTFSFVSILAYTISLNLLLSLVRALCLLCPDLYIVQPLLSCSSMIIGGQIVDKRLLSGLSTRI